MRLTDQDLIDEIRTGSQAAFEHLLRRYERLVYRIGFSYARQTEGASDIAQNVFLKVHRKLDTFHGRSSFSSWLSQIARNESSNWLRCQKRHTGHEELQPHNTPVQLPEQESVVLLGEKRARLLNEIQKLDERQSQAVILRYFERMPLREIASVLNCNENLVKSILFRSLKKLRKQLPEQERWDHE
ncbi:MAG: RNA polymerase sigma factor [bacterium]|nr:RNA polymerase sigma factor [bacterium]